MDNSLYGKIIKMPKFVPENLNYKKIDSFLNSKKLINASVALIDKTVLIQERMGRWKG